MYTFRPLLNPQRCNKLLIVFLLTLLLVYRSSFAITIGVVHDNVNERYSYIGIEESFQRLYPNIPVKFIGLSTVKYKPQVQKWLQSASGPDVLYWFGGLRLQQFIQQGYVEKINGLSIQLNWPEKFSTASLQATKYNGDVYAVPISYYQWGIFYNKQVLNNFDIQPPTNWQAFLEACATLKKAGIDPIAIGSQDTWTLGAWFDYINLRLNGLQFHQQLLAGEVPFTDKRVLKLFEYWAELVNQDYFLLGHQNLKWNAAMPHLFRGVAAFTLIGNFVSTRIPAQVKDNIGFISFPEIVPEYRHYEEAPMDVFFIRASSENKSDAEKFLRYLSMTQVQDEYNKYAGGFSPHKESNSLSAGKFNQQGIQLLQNAKGLSQFFDRDSTSHFAIPALEILKSFMLQPNISETIDKLETLRQQTIASP